MYNQFQLRMFKFVFILQVIVGPLALVSCDILCLLFIQKNKNIELLLLINLAHKKANMNMWLHENSVRQQRFVKFLLFLHFIATGKFELLGILELSRRRNIHIQAPHIQNPVRFRRFNIVQTSRSRGQHLCSKFAKIPHLGCPRTFKVSPPPP